MFSKPSKKIRESTYGFLATSIIDEKGSQKTINASNGTAFMIAPGYLVTAAHSIHQNNDRTKPVHQSFEFICAPNIGQQMEKAVLVTEDPIHDIALLKIENPKSTQSVTLAKGIIPPGTNCGFIGFPLSNVMFMQNGQRQLNLVERFQGAYISSYSKYSDQSGEKSFYEIDTLMYSGSSGCPAFTVEGKVVGMQVASVMQKRKEDNQSERVAISLIICSTEIFKFLKTHKIL